MDRMSVHLERVDVVGDGHDVQVASRQGLIPMARPPALSPTRRELLAIYLYFFQGQDVELEVDDHVDVIGVRPIGAPPLTGTPAVLARIPAGARGIEDDLRDHDGPRWRPRPELAAYFKRRSLAAEDISLQKAELEARRGISLAADGVVVPPPAARDEGKLIEVGVGQDGRVDSLTARLMFVSGRDMAAYPVAKALTHLAGPADEVGMDSDGRITLRYFVADEGKRLEYALYLRPLRGRPETGKDYFGFEMTGRIADVGAAIHQAKPVEAR